MDVPIRTYKIRYDTPLHNMLKYQLLKHNGELPADRQQEKKPNLEEEKPMEQEPEISPTILEDTERSDVSTEPKQTGKRTFSMPDPTIAELEDSEYLIITDTSDNMPSVCLFKIEKGKEMFLGPEIWINGAEMFLSSNNENKKGKITFLTNQRNMW